MRVTASSVSSVHYVSPYQYASADLKNPVFMQALASESTRSTSALTGLRGTASLCTTVHTRHWLYTEPTFITVDEPESSTFTSLFADAVDVIRVCVLPGNEIASDLRMWTRDNGKNIRGVISSVFTMKHADDDTVDDKYVSMGGMDTASDACCRMLRCLRYEWPSDSLERSENPYI